MWRWSSAARTLCSRGRTTRTVYLDGMKTILIFRHGKSDWGAAYGHDHDRPLAPRGRAAARAMGEWLSTTGPTPQSILCSTALRTRQTCSRAQKAGQWEASTRYMDALYGASPDDLLPLIRQEANGTQTLMLVGHEPTCSGVIGLLSDRMIGHFPTAAMARIDLPIAFWEEASFGIGALVWLQKPKEI